MGGDLAISHNDIGLLLSATGKHAEAQTAHESALAIRRRLVREHAESPDFASDLGGTLNNLAMIDLNAKRFVEARVRLLERDAQWLFEWGETWTLDASSTRVLKPGTPVFFVGLYDFDAPPPWRSPAWLAQAVELPPLSAWK